MGHEWETSVNGRRNGTIGCPVCYKLKKKGSDFVSKPLEAGYADDIPQIIAGGVVMEEPAYRSLNMEKIMSKKSILLSTEEALKDVIPIEWDTDVLIGNKQVILVEKK